MRHIFLFAGPRSRKVKRKQSSKASPEQTEQGDDKRPRTAFSAEQLAKLKVGIGLITESSNYGLKNPHKGVPGKKGIHKNLLCHISL